MGNKKLQAIITIGGAVASSLTSSLGTTKTKITEIGGAIRNLERQQSLLSRSIQTFGSLGKNVDNLRAKYASVTAEIDKAKRAQEKFNATQRKAEIGKAGMASAGVAIGGTLAAASMGLVPIMQAAKFEESMLGVAKQMDGARDSSGKLTSNYFDMARQIQLLGRELPMATNDIADMVSAGLRMGVANNEVLGFTRNAAKMATAFDLPASELAEDMGKIATIFKIPVPAIGELADTINYLDDNAISKGADIIEVMKRIGGTAQFVRMPAKEAAALASSFLTLGSSAEIAGTAANAVMRELSIATMQPKRFQAGLKAIGMTAKKVQTDMSNDATGTILKVLDALNKIPAEKRLTVATQLFGKEYGDDISKLAGGVKEYRRQLELANSEKAKGSMDREFAARMQTTNAQWEVFKNRITEVGVNIGSVLLPAINQVLGGVGSVTSAVADFVRGNSDMVGNIATAVGALAGFTLALNTLKFGFFAAMWAFNAFKLALATNPIGLALVLFATAAVMIYKNWEPLKAFFTQLWGSIKQVFSETIDWIAGKIEWISEKIGWIVEKAKGLKDSVTGLWDDTATRAGAAWSSAKTTMSDPENWAPSFNHNPMANISGVAPVGGSLWSEPKQSVPTKQPTPNLKVDLPNISGVAPVGGARTFNDNSTNTIHIHQQPGENQRDLARRIFEEQQRQADIKRRNQLHDGVNTN